MSWFVLSLICLLGWGFADLFYKKGTDEEDRYSHLKISVWVGLVMGVGAAVMLPFAETLSAENAFIDILRYSPASLSYIISMVIGYAGLRYLELSIVSPVQNASGALSSVCILVFFLISGKINKVSDELSSINIVGTVFIVGGVIALAIVEQRLSAKESGLPVEEKKYRFGALALLFPLLYCIFDTVGTAADGIILDSEKGLGLGEIDVLILYGLTFFVFGVLCWIYLFIKEKKAYNPFEKKELFKGTAALCEEFGQVFYIYAMAARPVLAAPLVASYCIVSVILSRIILKEKLKPSQYFCVVAVIIGIVLLGISDGLSEA